LFAHKCRFIPGYCLGNFKFDYAIPHLRVLVEIDGKTYHKEEKPTEDGLPKPLVPGTKAWVVHEHGWKLVRVQNGPRLRERFIAEVLKACQVVKA